MKTEIFEQARTHILNQQRAISGSGGSRQTYYVALLAVRHWALSDADALTILHEWNQTCQPPWKTEDLIRKISEARKAGKSAAPVGCLAETALSRLGGGEAALLRWKAKRNDLGRFGRTSPTPYSHGGTSFSRPRKDLDLSVRTVRNLQASAEMQPDLSRPAGPSLTPLETPWGEGRRYRHVATEIRNPDPLRNRLPLFVEDSMGDTLRKHGSLLAIPK